MHIKYSKHAVKLQAELLNLIVELFIKFQNNSCNSTVYSVMSINIPQRLVSKHVYKEIFSNYCG